MRGNVWSERSAVSSAIELDNMTFLTYIYVCRVLFDRVTS